MLGVPWHARLSNLGSTWISNTIIVAIHLDSLEMVGVRTLSNQRRMSRQICCIICKRTFEVAEKIVPIIPSLRAIIKQEVEVFGI